MHEQTINNHLGNSLSPRRSSGSTTPPSLPKTSASTSVARSPRSLTPSPPGPARPGRAFSSSTRRARATVPSRLVSLLSTTPPTSRRPLPTSSLSTSAATSTASRPTTMLSAMAGTSPSRRRLSSARLPRSPSVTARATRPRLRSLVCFLGFN